MRWAALRVATAAGTINYFISLMKLYLIELKFDADSKRKKKKIKSHGPLDLSVNFSPTFDQIIRSEIQEAVKDIKFYFYLNWVRKKRRNSKMCVRISVSFSDLIEMNVEPANAIALYKAKAESKRRSQPLEMWTDYLLGTPTYLVVHQSHHSRLDTHTPQWNAFKLVQHIVECYFRVKLKRKSPFLECAMHLSHTEGTNQNEQTKNQAKHDREPNCASLFVCYCWCSCVENEQQHSSYSNTVFIS